MSMKVKNNYKNILVSIKEKISKIDYEKNIFPSDKLLENIKSDIDKLETTLELINEQNKNITNIITELSKNLELKIQQINKSKGNILIPLNLTSYKESLGIIDLLIKNTYKLKDTYSNLILQKDRIISHKSELENIMGEIDYQNGELSTKNMDLNKLLSKKKAIEDILSNPDYQNMLNEVATLTKRQNEIPNLKNDLNR